MHHVPITTHILNLETGRPVAGLRVQLFRSDNAGPLASAESDKDGRIGKWSHKFDLEAGDYRLCFSVSEWYKKQGLECFYPQVDISFSVNDPEEHFHVPLLLNRHGYSTYRGT